MTIEKVAIVTGGSSGIGTADAVNLAKVGVKIVTTARRANEVEAGSDGIFVSTGACLGVL